MKGGAVHASFHFNVSLGSGKERRRDHRVLRAKRSLAVETQSERTLSACWLHGLMTHS